jgi:hypothetical protein
MRRRTLADWRREVYRSTTLSDRTKVLLLFLADNMREDRKVSVPREKVAAALGRSERRITERITEAHDAGWLWTVVRGQKGITAVYQGLFPDVLSGTDARPLNGKPSKFSGTPTSPLNDAETRPLNDPNQAFSGTHGGPTITRADPTEAGSDRNVGIDERWAPAPVVSSVHRSATEDREASA